MKRRDWKIKRLKKDFFGRSKITRRRKSVILRSLFVRQNNSLIKKTIVTNFLIYRNLVNSLFLKKFYTDNLYFYNNSYYNFIYIFPSFIFQKKVFSLMNKFKNSIFEKNLDYYYFKKQNNSLNLKTNNNKLVLFNKKNESIQKSFFDDEDNCKIFLLKYLYDNKKIHFEKDLNFFFNYNIYLFNVVEIYKIVTLIFLFKLK